MILLTMLICSLTISFLIRQFIKFLIKDNREIRINKKILLFEEYSKIANLLTNITLFPNIKRCSIVKVIDNPKKNSNHLVKILFTRGIGSLELQKNHTYMEVDDFYINFIDNIKKDELISINIEEIEECSLKQLSFKIDIKEFVAFKLISNKTKLIYCTLSSAEVGHLKDYVAEIKVLKIELEKLISSVF